jgi:hypothetical protein
VFEVNQTRTLNTEIAMMNHTNQDDLRLFEKLKIKFISNKKREDLKLFNADWQKKIYKKLRSENTCGYL